MNLILEGDCTLADTVPYEMFVCSEHSYGTMRDSSPEPEPEDGERLDHPYSAPQVCTYLP